MYRETAQALFGKWLKKRREELQKKRGAFAAAIGYQNLTKGARRVIRWEQGSEDPAPKYHNQICSFLAISPELWKEKREEKDFRHAIGDLNEEEFDIISKLRFLLSSREEDSVYQGIELLQSFQHMYI